MSIFKDQKKRISVLRLYGIILKMPCKFRKTRRQGNIVTMELDSFMFGESRYSDDFTRFVIDLGPEQTIADFEVIRQKEWAHT